MKRTLLASAFAVMALAASAQVSEVTKMKGDGFGFIPKSLTTTGVITPYSTIGVEYHGNDNQTAEFTVYDASFNVAKTFSYEPKVLRKNLLDLFMESTIMKKVFCFLLRRWMNSRLLLPRC